VLEEAHDSEELIERVAALDIGKAELVCCARVPSPDRPGRRLQEVATYQTMTRAGAARHLPDEDRAAAVQQREEGQCADSTIETLQGPRGRGTSVTGSETADQGRPRTRPRRPRLGPAVTLVDTCAGWLDVAVVPRRLEDGSWN
jgi:hypothetical protein